MMPARRKRERDVSQGKIALEEHFAIEPTLGDSKVFGAHVWNDLGHLGEGIPVQLWRIDGRNGWMKEPHHYPAKHGVGHYFPKYFHLTTSGNFHTPSLVNAMTEMGANRVMFSGNWPFEDVGQDCDWFDKAAINEAERAKVGRNNAVKLFKLKI